MARKVLIIAGVVSLFQALAQIIITSLCIGQYFCTIDFLRELPYLIFIKILYFSNPSSCGSVINIGQAIDGIANQAFVLIETEPYTSNRTFIISCTSLIVGCMWALASCTLLDVGTRSQYSRLVRWSWVTTTVSICAVDVVATICYANDSFHTRTLNDIMKYIGGSVSGTGGTPIDTSAASLIMVLLYSRCLVFFVLNVILIVLVALPKDDEGKPVEAPVTESPVILSSRETSHPVQPIATPAQKPRRLVKQNNVDVDDISFDEKSKKEKAWPDIPRVHYSNAFQTMKKYIFKRNFSMESQGDPEILSDRSQELDPEILSERLRYGKARRLMHFCENPVTLPRLRGDVHREYYTDGPGAATPHAAPALPVLNEISEEAGPSFDKGRRDTVAELQKQMPWSYIPSAFRRMRDQLPSDEDLPPVPLADYTAIGRTRKASVHRAASNLNSRKNYKTEL